jgi:hypothetical protein
MKQLAYISVPNNRDIILTSRLPSVSSTLAKQKFLLLKKNKNHEVSNLKILLYEIFEVRMSILDSNFPQVGRKKSSKSMTQEFLISKFPPSTHFPFEDPKFYRFLKRLSSKCL